MKSFSSVVDQLKKVLVKHPEIHYYMPKNPTEMDLREAAFVIEGFLGSKVIGDDALENWLDSYRFYAQGARMRE
jgi:hypothetical protein